MTSSADVRMIPTRRISFAEGLDDLPKHFANDDLISSHFFAVMSALFPDGEDFFVRSVRHYRDRITDPELQRAVAGFIGQESVHGREHRAVNERLAELGYPTKRVERFVFRGLATRTRVAPPSANLAVTAALEHFTATLAELAMTEPEAFDFAGHPLLQELFIWHALEESEHKSVAFDVYRTVGGSERLRVFTMRMTRVSMVFFVGFVTLLSVLGDPRSRQRGELRRSWRYFRRAPMFRREIWQRLCDYDRADFHPDDRSTDHLVDYWRTTLFGEAGALNDRLRDGRIESTTEAAA